LSYGFEAASLALVTAIVTAIVTMTGHEESKQMCLHSHP
jgi:hypothetical protein